MIIFLVLSFTIVYFHLCHSRIIKCGTRIGYDADIAMIELVDYNQVYNPGKAKKSKSTRRSRRGGGGSKPAAAPVVEATQSKEEE